MVLCKLIRQEENTIVGNAGYFHQKEFCDSPFLTSFAKTKLNWLSIYSVYDSVRGKTHEICVIG